MFDPFALDVMLESDWYWWLLVLLILCCGKNLNMTKKFNMAEKLAIMLTEFEFSQ